MMFRVIKIRLYPNKVQELKLNKVLGCYRFVYNQTLARKQQEYLVDKAFNNGKQVIFVDRFYPSSKTCSVCGYKKHDLKLSDREWICPQCGEHHDTVNRTKKLFYELIH